MMHKKTESNPFEKRARRKRVVRIVALAILAIAIGWTIFARPFGGPQRADSPFDSPSQTETTASAEYSEPPPNPEATILSERAQAFEELYRSFDWQTDASRMQALAEFGEATWLASIKQAQQATPYKAMLENKTVRTVTTVIDQGSDPEGTLATTVMDITVQVIDQTSSQPYAISFTSTVDWAYDPATKLWLVTKTDPE